MLHVAELPSTYIAFCLSLLPVVSDRFLAQIMHVFARDSEDPLLRWIMQTDGKDPQLLLGISALTWEIQGHRQAIFQLLSMMPATQIAHFISQLSCSPKSQIILQIMAISCAVTPSARLKSTPVKYLELQAKLNELETDQLERLYAKLCESNIVIDCLHDGLNQRTEDFTAFINGFESAPRKCTTASS